MAALSFLSTLRGCAASRLRVRRAPCKIPCCGNPRRQPMTPHPHPLSPSRGEGCFDALAQKKTQNPPLAPNGGEGSGVRGPATLHSRPGQPPLGPSTTHKTGLGLESPSYGSCQRMCFMAILSFLSTLRGCASLRGFAASRETSPLQSPPQDHDNHTAGSPALTPADSRPRLAKPKTENRNPTTDH